MNDKILTLLIGIAIGFVIGFVVRGLIGKPVVPIKNEVLVANVIGWGWIIWTFIATPIFALEPPSLTVDIISGGALGTILGERFFDYIIGGLSKLKK